MKNEEERDEFGFDTLTDDSIWEIINPDAEEGYSEPVKKDKPANAKEAAEQEDEDEEEEDDAPAPKPNESDDFEIPLNDEDDEEEEASDDNEEEDEEAASYFAKVYSEKGLLTIPEGLEVKTDEDFDKVIEHTIKEGVEQYKSSLGEDFAKVADFVKNGGDIKEYARVLAENVPSYEIDLSSEENQKFLYAEYLKETTKFSDAKINKLVESAEEDLELEDNASEAKEYFKTKEESLRAEMLEKQSERFEKAEQDKQEFVNKTKELINSATDIYDFPLGDKNKRQELSDYILKPSVPYVTPDNRKVLITQMQADKIELQKDKEKQYKTFIFEALQLKNKFNFEPVKKKGVTEHTKKAKELASKHKNKSTISRSGKTGGKDTYRSNGALSFDIALKEL